MLDLNEFREGLAAIVADLPASFTFNGTTFTGFKSQRSVSEELEPGGFLDQFDFRLHVPLQTKVAGTWANTFAVEPALGNVVVVTGSGTHKINRVTHSQDGLLLSLGLGSVNR